MSEEDRGKVAAWLSERVSPICPSCGSGDGFQVVNDIMTPVIMKGGNLQLGGEVVPMVGLLCRRCYNIRFFSAVLLGITLPNVSTEPPKTA